jgi:Ca2+-binding EF-hand superfamily protein
MQNKPIVFAVLVASASALGGVYFFIGSGDPPAKPMNSSEITQPQIAFADSTGGLVDSFEPKQPRQRSSANQSRSNRNATNNGSWGNFAERMAQFDLDGDGFLSKEERDAMRKARLDEILAKYDLDGDGELSAEEREAAKRDRFDNSERGQALMRQFDLDGDGVLNEQEQAELDAYTQAQREERAAERLAQYDRDGDGELSQEERQIQREERQAQWEQTRQESTDEFDLDGDGKLNIEERQNAIDAFLERREIDRFINQYDADGNGQMGAADYDAFVADYSAGNMSADVNRDGVIDTQDIVAYRDMVTRSGNRP